jgi:hypothetical protein
MPRGIFPRSIRPVMFVIGPSIAYVPLTQGKFALIEAEDCSLVNGKKWYASFIKDNCGYRAAHRISDKEHLLMHRLIMGATGSAEIDHKNCNSLDNRRHGNLRFSTRGQNMANIRRHRDNKSGFKGVFPYPYGFRARIMRSGKMIDLGCFRTAQEAHSAYCLKARELFGEFARFE